MNNKILVPVVTPFKKDESVDHEALKKLVRFVLDSGADGIYAGGSSAECFLMSEEERMAALETVVKAADGAFVIAKIGTVGSIPAETLAAHAEKAGANAVSSVPPFYFRFSFDEIAAYYHDLARKTKLPMMIYNIPDLTNNGFTVSQLETLLADDRVEYIKFTDTDYFVLEQIRSHTGKIVYSGKDEDFLSALAAGADGGIGSTFNFMVKKFIKIKELFDGNRMKEALKIQHGVNELVRCVCECGLIESIKYVLSLMGIPCGHARRPFRKLTAADEAKIKIALQKEGVL